jgi:hypothetical protein
MTKKAGSESESGSISQRQGSADPDPHKNVMDLEICQIPSSTLQKTSIEQAKHIRGSLTNFTFSSRPLNSLLAIFKNILRLEEFSQ